MDKKPSLHEHHRDRLREKVFADPNSINEYEALELILFNAIPRKNTNDIAHKLIDRFGSILAVLAADPEELIEIEGVGKSAACYIATLGKVIERNNDDKLFQKVFNFNDIRQPLIELYYRMEKEVFIVFYLDIRRRIFSRRVVTSNSRSDVEIDIKEFSRQVALTKPSAVIVTHNHPSGIALPSANDDKTTEKIALVLAVNNIEFMDHLIVAGEKIYSYHYDNRLDEIQKRVANKLS